MDPRQSYYMVQQTEDGPASMVHLTTQAGFVDDVNDVIVGRWDERKVAVIKGNVIVPKPGRVAGLDG